MKLRDFHLDDAEIVAHLCNDIELSKWTSSIPYPYTRRDADNWIAGIPTSGRISYAVVQDNQLIGCVSMWDYEEETVEIGYWVGREYWGRGFGKKAVSLLLDRIRQTAYKKVVALVMSDNIASQTLLMRCGFRQSTPIELSRFGVYSNGHIYTLQLTEH